MQESKCSAKNKRQLSFSNAQRKIYNISGEQLTTYIDC